MSFDFSRKNAEGRKPLKSPRKILRGIGTAVLIAISFTLVTGRYSAGVASLNDGAMATTQGLVRRSLQILRNTNAPVTQRRRELRAVLEGHFDFPDCLLYTSPSPRDLSTSRMPSSA